LSPYASAHALRQAFARGKLGAHEWMRAQIAHIERADAAIHAVVVRDFDRALAAAREADARRTRGEARPLEGVPVTVKESIHVEGLPCTVGRLEARDWRPAADAPAVRRLRAAGAIVIGKTNVPPEISDWQAGNDVYGRTSNPWDLSRTSGGSSGGAAAVAAGCSALDLGSDIGGSVRVPSAFCGVYGLRPSDTLIARSGQLPVPAVPHSGAVLAVFGPIARAPADLDLALTALAGADVGEDRAWRVSLPPPRVRRLAGARIALLRPPACAPVAPEVAAALESTADALRRAGAIVAPAMPDGFGDGRESMRLYMRLLGYMMMSRWPEALRQKRARDMAASGCEFQAAMAEGMVCSGAQVFGWYLAREGVRQGWRRFFEGWDALLTPAFHTTAFPHRPHGEPALTAWHDQTVTVAGQVLPYTRGLFYPHVATLAGQPAVTLPAGLSAEGLPVGLQLVGPYLEDRTLTRLAALIARENGGFLEPPWTA
jgi:amidase